MLEINNVRVVYPNGTEALKSVSMTIQHNEVVAIIGRSGAGKSTLLRCINGMQEVTSGSIKLDGREITTMSKKQQRDLMRHVGFHLARIQPRRAFECQHECPDWSPRL